MQLKFRDVANPEPPQNLQDYIARSNSVPWNYNWTADKQPLGRDVDGYMALARDLRVQALQDIKKFLQSNPGGIVKDDNSPAGYYALEAKSVWLPETERGIQVQSIDKLIADIKENDDIINSGNINCAQDNRFLKSKMSAIRKNKEYEVGGVAHPENIGDYLRFQVLFEDTNGLAKARYNLQFGQDLDVTSQKDRLRRPHEETGHRAYMASVAASQTGQKMKFELMLSLLSIETFESDKTVRDSVRSCLAMTTTDNPHLSATYSAAAGMLGDLARLTMDTLYSKVHQIDALLDPDINVALSRDLTSASLAEAVKSCGGLLGRFPTSHTLYQSLIQQHLPGNNLQ